MGIALDLNYAVTVDEVKNSNFEKSCPDSFVSHRCPTAQACFPVIPQCTSVYF